MRGSDVASVRELHRGRHVVVRAQLADRETYVIKLASAAAAERERTWYRTFGAVHAGGAACRFVDAILPDGVLLFAVHPAATDAREFAVTRQRLPREFGANVARQLAALHARDVREAPLARIAPATAWQIDHADPRCAGVVARCVRVQDALVPVALVHADVRWENVILGGEKDEPSLVDWEDAGRGAPAWDLGCLFASFASFAIRAEVRFGMGPGAETLEAMMRAQVNGAWCGYSAGSNHARDRSFLHAAIRCAGVRLAEAAFAPAIAAPSELEVAALVDAATEMLDDPSRAAARWYGLDDSMA